MENIVVKQINFTDNLDDYIALWHACFPEDADFAEDFFKYGASLSKGLAVFEEDRPVSMAFFLPSTIHVDGKTFSAYYVYGVATLPAHREKGYAKTLLETAKTELCCDLLFLYPAQPSLRTFYERLGYRAILGRDRIADAVYEGALPLFESSEFCASSYAEKRSHFLNETAHAYATFEDGLLQALLGHATVLDFAQGCVLCICEDETVYLPELLCEEKAVPMLITAVKRRYPDKQVVAYRAGEQDVVGMVLPCSESGAEFFDSKINVPFFGSFFAE